MQISNFFTLKDIISLFLLPGILYKFQCGGCNTNYYIKTKCHFKMRTKGDDDFVMKEYLEFYDHSPNFHDFSILVINNDDMRVVLINRDHSHVNKNRQSLPLALFDN